MPTVNPSSVPSPRGVLGWDGANFYVLRTDATGRLQLHVLSSALPLGAATAAHQVTQNTALQLIDDLQDALQSVANDRLIVRGEDQLFTIKGVLAFRTETAISGASGYIDTGSVPAGEYWVITTITAADQTTGPTAIAIYNSHDGAIACLHEEKRAFAATDRAMWSGHTYLDVDDVIRVYYVGAAAADTCRIEISGYRMTVET